MNIQEINPQKEDHPIWQFLKKKIILVDQFSKKTTKNYQLVPKNIKKYQKVPKKYQKEQKNYKKSTKKVPKDQQH